MSEIDINPIREKVIEFVSEQVCLPMDKILLQSKIEEDLGADSLDKIEICMALEGHYDFDIPNDVLKDIKTVYDFVNVVVNSIE